jgi:hypothetical protein
MKYQTDVIEDQKVVRKRNRDVWLICISTLILCSIYEYHLFP